MNHSELSSVVSLEMKSSRESTHIYVTDGYEQYLMSALLRHAIPGRFRSVYLVVLFNDFLHLMVL